MQISTEARAVPQTAATGEDLWQARIPRATVF